MAQLLSGDVLADGRLESSGPPCAPSRHGRLWPIWIISWRLR